jgi:hypothetical protein
MEVQIVNKAKGETDIIIGIESPPEKTEWPIHSKTIRKDGDGSSKKE